MTPIPFPNQELVEEQAAQWIAKIDRGLSPSEKIELDAWLEVSSLHGETLLKCASMWDLLDVLRPISKLLPIEQESNNERGLELSAANDTTPIKQWMIAASVLLVVGAFLLIGFFTPLESQNSPVAQPQEIKPPESISQTYKTAIGEISAVSLQDGSSLKLNTNSELIVKFSKTRRSIELLRGEVYFDVAKDADRPFVVAAGGDRVTAIGTAFSVDAGDVALASRSVNEVIVTKGRVEVSGDEIDRPIYLTPGQVATAKDNSFQVSDNLDSDSLLAWRKGMVVFRGETLTEVIREIDRYTPLKFTILDQELASITVGGFFKTGDLDQLLLVLENNFGVASEKRDGEIFLSKK